MAKTSLLAFPVAAAGERSVERANIRLALQPFATEKSASTAAAIEATDNNSGHSNSNSNSSSSSSSNGNSRGSEVEFIAVHFEGVSSRF